jgi:transcriptional regulator with PAS, ATPase and Fis domain
MSSVTKRLAMVAPLDVHVLLTGPTGVGKSLVARAIHSASRRANSPYCEINCAAIPDALLESELFGAARGAHSAVGTRGVRGKVEAAEGGTLFLDEIAELEVGSQAKLLQLLQDAVYYRLGESEPRQSDVRIIAATNVDLDEAIATKTFREDLYYRLSVVETAIPPLSEREEDILPLARHFLRLACDRFELPPKRLSKDAQRALVRAAWPGNVRQLRHRIESAALDAHLHDENRAVTEADIFGAHQSDHSSEEGWREVTRQFQRRHLLGILETSEWNISEVAARLGLARSHVYNLMHEHGLSRVRMVSGS